MLAVLAVESRVAELAVPTRLMQASGVRGRHAEALVGIARLLVRGSNPVFAGADGDREGLSGKVLAPHGGQAKITRIVAGTAALAFSATVLLRINASPRPKGSLTFIPAHKAGIARVFFGNARAAALTNASLRGRG